jgi:beta-lactamase class A
MTRTLDRRTFLALGAGSTLLWAINGYSQIVPVQDQLKALEADWGGRLGVFVLDTANGRQISHRADERFPLCSTFKVMLAAAILAKDGPLQQRIRYASSDMVSYSPITEKHIDGGMTVAELCAAALQYSDNTAANLLMQLLGGPAIITAFARSIGDREFRLDRWETELNTAIPGDPRDTTTPAAMAHSLAALTLGPVLSARQSAQLNTWMLGNTTGGKRIRAAVPSDWIVGDKTGSGEYGTANDIAVLRAPNRKPIVLAIYTTHPDPKAGYRDDLIAAATRIVLGELA